MLYTILMMAAFLVVIYFHYLQGFFSATISAVLAVLAAMIAIGWHEWVIGALLGGKMADQSTALVLVGLFALVYLILRVLFDAVVPGNVRLPVAVDKVGAAAMGVVAALCGVGVLAVAAQSLPFEGMIGGYSRYQLQSVQVRLRPPNDRQDDFSFQQADPKGFLSDEARSLLVPADQVVLGLAAKTSAGSLFAGTPWRDVHPSFLQELYGQRVGIQAGAAHTALPRYISVSDVFVEKSLPQVDAESSKSDAQFGVGVRFAADRDVTNGRPVYQPEAGRTLLVVRVRLDDNAADENGLFGFSPGGARLVARDETGAPHNHFAIGTFERGTLYRSLPDDFLFARPGKAMDLVFDVPEGAVKDGKVQEGVILEVKRLAKEDLSGRAVTAGVTPPKMVKEGDADVPETNLARKGGVWSTGGTAAGTTPPTGSGTTPPAQGTGTTPPPPPPPAKVGPVTFVSATVNAKLPGPLSLNANVTDSLVDLGSDATGSVKEGKFDMLKISPLRTLQIMGRGQYTADEFYVPPGQQMVQVKVTNNPDSGWEFAQKATEFELATGGGSVKPQGFYATVQDGAQSVFAAQYKATAAMGTPNVAMNGTPSEVTLLFLIPAGQQAQSLKWQGQVVGNLK